MTGSMKKSLMTLNRKVILVFLAVLITLLLTACADDNLPKGSDLYVDLCADCHGNNNQGVGSHQIPGSIPPVIEQSEFGISDAIFNIPAMARPDLESLNLDEINAIALYLSTIGPDGQALFEDTTIGCSGCHGVNNEGVGGLANPIPTTATMTVPQIEALIANAILNVAPMSVSTARSGLTIGEVTAIAIHVSTLPLGIP